MSLEAAIRILQAEVTAFGQGTKTQPAEGSPEWFLLRAKVCGLTLLKKMQQLELDKSPKGADILYKKYSREVKAETAVPLEAPVGPS